MAVLLPMGRTLLVAGGRAPVQYRDGIIYRIDPEMRDLGRRMIPYGAPLFGADVCHFGPEEYELSRVIDPDKHDHD